MSRRRLLFALISLAAYLAPFGSPSAVDAQQPAAVRRIGVLLLGFSPVSREVQQFKRGLQEAGYVEGRDLVIEWRSAHGDYARLPGLAAELVDARSDVIVVESTGAARAIKQATPIIPIVMAVVGDPVGSGLVPNLAHPGGHITGLSLMTADLSVKRLQLIKETIPDLTRLAVLWNPDTPFHIKVVSDMKAAAPSLSIELGFMRARTPEEVGAALSDVKRHAQALYVIDDPIFFSNRTALLKLASKAQIPAIYAQKEFAEDGGLMSYGPNFGELFHRSAGYVAKILKGSKPGDLPIEQPTKFELIVNLKTAKSLGITMSDNP